jgi:hypothetical protein
MKHKTLFPELEMGFFFWVENEKIIDISRQAPERQWYLCFSKERRRRYE